MNSQQRNFSPFKQIILNLFKVLNQGFGLMILFLIFSCNGKMEDFKPTVKLDSILKNKRLDKKYADFRLHNVYLYSGIEKRESFIKFSKETSIDDLILMTECEKPIIRCFAYKMLIEKDYPKIRELLFKHQNDSETIDVYHLPCIRMNQGVKFYMLQQLDPFSKSKMKFNRVEYYRVLDDFSK